jgi:hypothetical protein
MSLQHHYHHPLIIYRTNRISNNKHSLHRIFTPKFSTLTHTHEIHSPTPTNYSPHHLSLVQEINKLCQQRNLARALDFLQRYSIQALPTAKPRRSTTAPTPVSTTALHDSRNDARNAGEHHSLSSPPASTGGWCEDVPVAPNR